MTEIINCPDCKYYFAPVCTFHKWLPMTSRKGFCHHADKGKYDGGIPVLLDRETVIRCGKCKHYVPIEYRVTGDEVESYKCEYDGIEKGERDFCSWAERRENERS